jgi:hypothetical protein
MRNLAKSLAFALISVFLFSTSDGAVAETSPKGRIKTGVKLFRTMLAADLDIAGKTDSDGKLFILLVYEDNLHEAENIGKLLTKSKKPGTEAHIRGISIKIAYTSETSFQNFNNNKIAGIFIAQQFQAGDLEKVIQYGIKNHLIVYSPFEGDVEKGVLGGLSVEARVRPYINAETLRASGISIKPFFMKVTKIHE